MKIESKYGITATEKKGIKLGLQSNFIQWKIGRKFYEIIETNQDSMIILISENRSYSYKSGMYKDTKKVTITK